VLIYILMGILGLIVILILFIWIYWHLKNPLLREKEPGFQYVYVEDDGSVREVSKEDEDYLTQRFDPTDGARPYIKSSYRERTPGGKLSGFIDRRRVPKKITISKLS